MVEYRPLDENLITSDVCVQCGRCCKTTWLQPRWNKAERNSHRVDKIPYLKEMFSQSTTSFVEERGDKVAGVNTFKCGIYETRPDVCAAYNCFTAANGMKRNPEYFDFIKGLIERVHGTDPYKRRTEESKEQDK